MLRNRLLRAVPVALLILLALPAWAAANELTQVELNIRKNAIEKHVAAVDACAFTTKQLNAALSQIPNDLAQYESVLGTAIRGALRARAAGACDKRPTPAPTTSTPQIAAPTITTTTPASPSAGTAPTAPVIGPSPAPPTLPVSFLRPSVVPVSALTVSSPDTGPPAPLIVLAGLAAVLAVIGLFAFVVHRLGLDPRWVRPVRHAFGEAGWRSAGTWEDFTDWLRFGR